MSIPVDIMAFDTETGLIMPGVITPPLVCVTWARRCIDAPEQMESGILDAVEGPVMIEQHLRSGGHVVGHNIAFDLAVLVEERAGLWPVVREAYEQGRVHDTMIREELIDCAQGTYRRAEVEDEDTGELVWKTVGYSLADCALRRLGLRMGGKTRAEQDLEDPWRLRYIELMGVPLEQWPEAATEYAVRDAEITLGLFWGQQDQWPEMPTEADQTRAAWALHAMSARGVCIDPEQLNAWAAMLRDKVREARALLAPTGIFRSDGSKNLNTLRALVRAAYEARGDSPPLTPKGDEVSTSYSTLVGAGSPELDAMAHLGALEKLLTAFVPALAKGLAAPLQARYTPIVATNRTSCSGPNLQQMPKVAGARECVVPRRGHWLASVDYSALELRTLAQACLDLLGESALAALFQADPNADPHILTAATIMGIDPVEAMAMKKAKDPAIKLGRQKAKAANFGYPGGLGARKFVAYAKASYDLVITEEEARSMRTAWMTTWPEVPRMQAWVSARLDPMTSEGTFALTRPTEEEGGSFVRGRSGYTNSCNFLFQGLAALGAKRALWRAVVDGPAHGCFPVVFVHDEIIAEVPDNPAGATHAAEWLAETMCAAMSTVCPDVPITAEPALMRRWLKAAEPVRDPATGLLVPWEPEPATTPASSP